MLTPVPAEANTLRMGIKAYHGSPHDFDAFDLSKIGTGEGAQAYGHGLYFAENPAVAEGYRNTLSDPLTREVHFGDPNERFHIDELSGADALAAKARWKYDPDGRPWTIEHLDNYANEAEAQQALHMLNNDEIHVARPGRSYQVNINADPEHFLDWDKPLNEQPPKVQEAFRKLGIDEKVRTRGEEPGKSLSDIIANEVLPLGQATEPNISATLQKAGIPGVKYLDQGSRALHQQGSATRNYVVFDDKLIDIVRKYSAAGIALPPAIAAAYQQMQEQQPKLIPVDHDPFAQQ